VSGAALVRSAAVALLVAAGGLPAAALPAAAGAQAIEATPGAEGADSAEGAPLPSCAARIPPDSLVRVVVHLEANVADSATRPILPSADLLLQLASERVQRRLGASPGTVPLGDAVVAWPDLGVRVAVTLHRDGRFTWPATDDPAETPAPAAELLRRALADLAADGERVFWPEGLPGDSAAVELHFHHAVVRPDGTAEPLRLRVAMPLLSLPVPRTSPVVQTRSASIAYPELSLRGGAVGTVVLEFVVDTAGRVDPATVRELWSPGRPRLTGDVGRYYDAFLKATMRGLATARYEPARVGGCAVRQLVQQPFEYRFR
jgi:hypothetical protein